MTVYAQLEDLSAIGAIPTDEPLGSLLTERANWLLINASAQAENYLVTRYNLDVSTLSATQLVVLAGIVAEIAASRLQSDSAPSTDFAPNGSSYVSSMMNRQHERALDRLVVRSGSHSITIDRDPVSSFLGFPRYVDPYWLNQVSLTPDPLP